MYRHVVKRLRAHGVDNMVTVLVHMAYVPHTTQSWFNQMYPGDDVVDWIGFDTYAYSDPGYGHGDFAEVLNRRSGGKRSWPGFYNWAVTPASRQAADDRRVGRLVVQAEHPLQGRLLPRAGLQLRHFPKIRAMVQFETPHNQKGQDSSVDSTPAALQAYRNLGHLPIFQVAVTPWGRSVEGPGRSRSRYGPGVMRLAVPGQLGAPWTARVCRVSWSRRRR